MKERLSLTGHHLHLLYMQLGPEMLLGQRIHQRNLSQDRLECFGGKNVFVEIY